jgi:hypothetical protein
MAIEKREIPEDNADTRVSSAKGANPAETLVQTAAKEPTKKAVKESRRTDFQDAREYDPYQGVGGTFTINDKGERVRVNDKGEEIKGE